MRKNIFFMVLILSLVFVILFPNINMAQSLDQMLVIDDANIFGDKIVAIQSAAEELQSQGADVRVRTITSFGAYGNLDQYELQLEQRSPSWIGQNGDIKNNLIVLIISLEERETGLYYGEIWTNVLDDNWNRIQSDIMHPLFKDGDYAGGVIQGLKEIQRLIKEKDQTQSPTGQSKSWIIPLVFLIILVLVIGFFVFSRYRQNKAKISAVRQKAILAKQAAASGINELIEATQMLDIKVNVTADKIAPEEAVPLRNGLEKATGLVNRSSQAYSDLSHSAGNPENPRLGEAELGVIEPEYQKIVIDLRDARDAIKDVEARIAGVQQTIDGFPQKVTEVNTAIKEALNKENGLQTAGFKTTYIKDLINKSSETLGQANSLVAKRQYNEAMKFVGSANNQIQQAFQAMEDLPGKKQAAESAIPILASRIEEVKEKINDGGEVFERLSGEYAESTWEPIRGNGTEAENRVNWALDALGESQIDVGMEKQDWPEALKLVEKGNTWLTEAESLVKSITELEVNLMAARRDAPGEINSAQADVTKAWEYINRYDEDIRESLEDDLRAAEKKNELAKEELRQEKPDYFKVCKLACEANEAADKILIQARTEHEAAERLRAKVVSARRDASARVSIARKYVEDHYPVVKTEARSFLNNAIQALQQADITNDINSQILSFVNAESAADRAYSLAQRDVNNSWERPQSSAGRPNMNPPNIGIPTILFPTMGHSSGSNQSWGSSRPSSSSGNTIRRGGGGSSSWGAGSGGFKGGGGSSRGGGSSGW